MPTVFAGDTRATDTTNQLLLKLHRCGIQRLNPLAAGFKTTGFNEVFNSSESITEREVMTIDAVNEERDIKPFHLAHFRIEQRPMLGLSGRHQKTATELLQHQSLAQR